MKNALSIALGGELLAPENCDYTSYSRLGLVCPVCRNPVFLVNASVVATHSRKEKTIQGFTREAHFSHFYEKDRLSDCENRSGVSEVERLAYQSEARNQRLAVFVGSFCEILELNPRLLDINKAPRATMLLLNETLQNELKAASVYSIVGNKFWQYLKTNQQTIVELMSNVSIEDKISNEAFKFMISDEGKKVLTILFWYLYYFGGNINVDELTKNILQLTQTSIIDVFESISLSLIEVLVQTPWIQGFTNLQNK